MKRTRRQIVVIFVIIFGRNCGVRRSGISHTGCFKSGRFIKMFKWSVDDIQGLAKLVKQLSFKNICAALISLIKECNFRILSCKCMQKLISRRSAFSLMNSLFDIA